MHEPAVALTDFTIALECVVFCVLVLRRGAGATRGMLLRRWWLALFGSVGIGAALGGMVHGFAPAEGAVRVTLWRATLLSLGVTAAAMWNIGALIALRDTAVAWMQRAGIAMVVAYAIVVLFAFDRFVIALAAYLPAAVFLAAVLLVTYARTRARGAAAGLIGLALSFLAAAIQQLRVAIHPTYFDHNALYHLVQAIGLYFLFVAAHWSVITPVQAGADQ